MGKVQEMLVPEGVFALLAAVIAVGAREWRRVQTAREKRRVREQELLAEMVAEVADGSREVQVYHGGIAGTWSLTGTGFVRERQDTAGSGLTDAAAVSRTHGRIALARRRR
ncbi:hypothetical protein [Streptomyces geranii]|uniref:hypothetical protein n=1 Tax=Streptomyces geranii TaxID=2058923 RepID=UPI000D03E5B3|nr:hypothetical protein [Streptomyces geranii]